MIRRRHSKTPYKPLHNKPPNLSYLHVFGALCNPMNDRENLGKLQLKADIGIFIGYAPMKKAFRIYNRRTRRIIETIHVDFDELAAMASEHSSSGPALHEMTPATINSGRVPNPHPTTPFVPPSRTDRDMLFQPLFDEFLNPSLSVDHPAPEVVVPINEVIAPVLADSTGSWDINTIRAHASACLIISQMAYNILRAMVAMFFDEIEKVLSKKTGRKASQCVAKEPVGFDETKVKCYNCHKTCHFAREYRTKGNQDGRRKDAWNSGNKDGRRSGKQEDSKALVTLIWRRVWYDDPIIEEYESDNERLDYVASGTKKVSTTRHSFNRQAVLTSAAMKVNTVKPIVNKVRPKTVFHKTDSPFSRPFNKTTALRTNFSKQKVNTAKVNAVSAVGGKRETADYPHRALQNKGIVDSGCSRHMTRNKAYLDEYQEFNGGPVAFGGSKGYITGKGKIKTGKLDFEDVCFVKELQHFNLFSVSQMCDKKNKVLFTDLTVLFCLPEFKYLMQIKFLL
ncbi:retrovirus-related pol polyprotein from transposon TNT 1-94 [Tanacetum coccineum]